MVIWSSLNLKGRDDYKIIGSEELQSRVEGGGLGTFILVEQTYCF